MNCFLRIFYLKQLILTRGIDQIIHLDSDCIIMDDVNTIFQSLNSSLNNIKVGYSVQTFAQQHNPYHMVGSVHGSLLNLDFCNKMIELCFDIYENKSKFHLIESKVNWHRNNNHPGGICDMTIYYLISSTNLVEVSDFNKTYTIDNELCTFDHQIYGNYGYLGSNTYKTIGDGKKKLIKQNNKYYFETVNGDLIRVLTIHFQGEYAKYILENLYDMNSLILYF